MASRRVGRRLRAGGSGAGLRLRAAGDGRGVTARRSICRSHRPPGQMSQSCRPSIAAKASPASSATVRRGAWASASGSSSAAAIQIIAPAAKPRPTGSSASNCSTNRYAGTAMSGWGRLEKMLHAAAERTRVPRGTSTRLIAKPSGMLCTAIASAISRPNAVAAAERRAHADALGGRVHRHHADDQHRLAGVGAAEPADLQRALVVDGAVREDDEERSRGRAEQGAERRPVDALDDEPTRCAEHHPGRDRVRRAEPERDLDPLEREGQRAETGRERRAERGDEDDEHSGHRATLLTGRARRLRSFPRQGRG